MPSLPVLGPPSPAAARWTVARRLTMLVAALLVMALVFGSVRAMHVVWFVVVPLLPAIFFINPIIWRSVCPLATLNELGNAFGAPRALPPHVSLALSSASVLLFHLLVPARHLLWNQHPAALVVIIAFVGSLAIALGAMFAVRSAFCNALCPMLPLELLYGSSPLVDMPRGRCADCTLCTPRGCIDLAKQKALTQRLGPSRRTARWLMTPYGIFAAALPGFIVGFYRVGDGPIRTAGAIYASTVGWSLASVLAVMGLAALVRFSASLTLPCIAAVSGILYYWYTAPLAIGQVTSATWPVMAFRASSVAFVAYWLVRALKRAGGLAAVRGPSRRYVSS